MVFDDLGWFLMIFRNHVFFMILSDFVTCITWRRVLRTPSLSERESPKFFTILHDFQKMWSTSKGSRPRTEMACIPLERTSTIMIMQIENDPYDEVSPEIGQKIARLPDRRNPLGPIWRPPLTWRIVCASAQQTRGL